MQIVPTALSVQGGGFTVLSMTMGFANTFHQSGFFEGLTHLGGISGGSWFATQFAYSEEFYNSVTGINGDTPTEAASKWGETYQNAMENAIAEAQFNNWTYTVGQLGPTCAATSYQPVNTSDTTLADFWTVFFNDLQEKLYFPASNYLNYVGSFWIPTFPTREEPPLTHPGRDFLMGPWSLELVLAPMPTTMTVPKLLTVKGLPKILLLSCTAQNQTLTANGGTTANHSVLHRVVTKTRLQSLWL